MSSCKGGIQSRPSVPTIERNRRDSTDILWAFVLCSRIAQNCALSQLSLCTHNSDHALYSYFSISWKKSRRQKRRIETHPREIKDTQTVSRILALLNLTIDIDPATWQTHAGSSSWDIDEFRCLFVCLGVEYPSITGLTEWWDSGSLRPWVWTPRV